MSSQLSKYKPLLLLFREGLRTGLTSREEVISWADAEIMNEAEPDYLLIDLSMSKNVNDLIGILNDIDNDGYDSVVTARALIGLLWHEYAEGRIDFEKAVAIIDRSAVIESLTTIERSQIYLFDYWDYDDDTNNLETKDNLVTFLEKYQEFNYSTFSEWNEISARMDLQLAPLNEAYERDAELAKQHFLKVAAEREQLQQRNYKQTRGKRIFIITTLASCLILVIVLAIFVSSSAYYVLPVAAFGVIRGIYEQLDKGD